MKKLIALSASMLGLAAFASSSHAQVVVSVQFPSYYASPYATLNGSKYGGPSTTTTAGVVSEGDWNDAMGPSTAPNSFGGGDGQVTGNITNANLFTWVTNPSPGNYPNNGPYTVSPTATLLDSNGASSAVTFTLGSATSERGNNNQAEIGGSYSTGDSQLAGGGAFNYGGTTSLSFGNLNATDSYNVIAYLDFDYYSTVQYGSTPPYSVVEASLGGTNYYADSQPQNLLTAWTEATGTSAATANLANYVEYDGLSGAALEADTLTVNGGAGFSGFQLVDNGTAVVPEPSTWAMMLGGLGMLALCVRRKAASIK